MSYYKDSQFEQWLKANGDNQASQSRGYIDSILLNILSKYHLDSIFKKLNFAIQNKDNTIAKLEELYNKLNKAATLKIHYPSSNVLGQVNNAASSITQWCSVLKKYIDFLQQTVPNQPVPNQQKYKTWGAQSWNNALKKFWDQTISAIAIDGYSSLLNAGTIGTPDNFVKLAIESSYFLNATAINKRHNDLLNMLHNGVPIPARKSSDSKIQKLINNQLSFVSGNTIIPIVKDPDGNKEVRKLIENITGYSVSSGYDCFFTNFKISHIWGQAYDPRMFTSLWNIVIVPAWANDLLDKTNTQNDLAQKMINTFKAVCEKLYATSQKWNTLGLNNVVSSKSNFVVHNQYNINIIGNRNNSPVATISPRQVTV